MSELRLVVDIPAVPPRTDKNSRKHWSVTYRQDHGAWTMAYVCARDARNGGARVHADVAEIAWTVYLPKGAHKSDLDNMITRLKPFQDGIFQALDLDDKIVRAISVEQERDPEGRGRTVAVVTARRREEA